MFMGRLQLLETHLQYLEDAASINDVLFPPSFIGPDAHWTSQEKALFFQSIARHSKWRPDLIAEDLNGSKTVGDIWAYIQLLDEGSVTHPPVPSSDLPLAAQEMSDKWIAREEELANEIISNEAKWTHHTNLKARRDHLHTLRDSLADPLHDTRSFDDQKKSLKRIWRKVDIISKLDLSLLRRMDCLSHGMGDARRSQIRLESRKPSTSRKRVTPLEYKPESVPDLSNLTLTPLERKRLRQRLWVRQKRAIQNGLSPSKSSMYPGKIKRGRKPSKPNSDSQSKKTNATISVKQASVKDVHPRDGGGPLNKNRDLGLERYDITKESLFEDGLNIFHLERFVILPSLFGYVYGSGSPELGDRHFITYDMLCYLRISLVHFLTSVIGMAVTHRRTSIRQRRIDEFIPDIDISRENILASLLSLGQSVDKDCLFERMYAILRSRRDDGAVSDQETLNINPDPVKTSFLPNPPITHVTTSLPILSDEDIIGEDIDEQSLLQELASEEALEQNYILLDQEYEKQLWVDGEDEMEVN